MTEIIKQMINCHGSVCDIYLRCTNLVVHFVAIYIFHCVLSRTIGRHHFVVYIGGRFMTYDVKLYVWDGYVIEHYIFRF